MSSPHDFSRRRKKGFRTLERVAEEGRGGAAPLFLSYDLARRAGKIVAPILRPFGMSLDFPEGHARVENGTLILLTQSAAQANRIRNLSTRLRVALSSAGCSRNTRRKKPRKSPPDRRGTPHAPVRPP